jgi:hypothetical protein
LASFFGVKSGNLTTTFFSFDFLSAICVGAPLLRGWPCYHPGRTAATANALHCCRTHFNCGKGLPC